MGSHKRRNTKLLVSPPGVTGIEQLNKLCVVQYLPPWNAETEFLGIKII